MEALILTDFLPPFSEPEISLPQVFPIRNDFGQDIIQMFIDIAQVLGRSGLNPFDISENTDISERCCYGLKAEN